VEDLDLRVGSRFLKSGYGSKDTDLYQILTDPVYSLQVQIQTPDSIFLFDQDDLLELRLKKIKAAC
jgi:hypothetical protein